MGTELDLLRMTVEEAIPRIVFQLPVDSQVKL